ncbi:transglycosylase domain-containing protein [Enterobacter asburiae]|jgi:membrane peptidoglycan carboxypeptidase|uniref:biosynthetic peptidoglycan transglycosylase n=1 Tax=Enterobacter asburiae TaxID=61645 RepID=UPI003896EC26
MDQPKNGQIIRNFKNVFICLNYDLFEISDKMRSVDNYSEFDDFEFLVMSLEDRRFLRHCGYDLKACLREVFKLLSKRKHGGASTIDMQMVRTITNFRDLTFYRKLYEIILSVLVNYKFTKKQIIRCYLKNAFFGTRLYGYEVAARKTFNKQFEALDYYEKAFLAAMLLRPKPLMENEKWRQSVIIRAMYAQRMRVFVK